MRSYEQFERKVVQIGHGYEQLPDRSPLVGLDQLALLELQRAGKLRDYYDGLVLDRDALERGLRMGTIVVDRRLENFMRSLNAGELARARPDAPCAGAMLRRFMDALGEIEQSREELAGLRSEVRAERERAEQLRGRVAELSANLERSSNELQSTAQALHALRSSRLMRSTAEARRLYYRATGKG